MISPGAPQGATLDPAALRAIILEMAFSGSTGHIACAFSLVEVMSALYKNHVRYPDNDPEHPDRDYLVLSKGHGVMAQYACMYQLGWLDYDQHIRNYFADGSDLKGLSDSRIRGLEVTSGSLGHGLSVATGLALGLKLEGRTQKVYAIVGDGEMNEGPIWEAMMFAAHHQLDNLMVIVDANGFQAMGPTADIITLDDLHAKFTSFQFATAEVDGHDGQAISVAIDALWNGAGKQPKALIARTVKGKGVSFMEGANEWHYKRLDTPLYAQAIDEVRGRIAS